MLVKFSSAFEFYVFLFYCVFIDTVTLSKGGFACFSSMMTILFVRRAQKDIKLGLKFCVLKKLF